LGASNDKGYRTSLHNFFNLHFQLPTDTVSPPAGGDEEGGSSDPTKKDSKRPHLCIRVHPKKHPRGGNNGGGGGQGGQKRSREENDDNGWGGHQRWPSGVGHYLEFTLCKENKDTGDAIGILSRILHLKPKAFGFAGTKDWRVQAAAGQAGQG
jgi:tRNA pseudouridine13 synthase